MFVSVGEGAEGRGVSGKARGAPRFSSRWQKRLSEGRYMKPRLLRCLWLY